MEGVKKKIKFINDCLDESNFAIYDQDDEYVYIGNIEKLNISRTYIRELLLYIEKYESESLSKDIIKQISTPFKIDT